ncbi:peptidylprolyl isomerase [bacterium]|nr:peptidylprolyl isomerase [bacterium]
MCLAQQGEVNRSSKSDKKTISKKPHILIKTSMGEIEVELYREKAPVSVNNFLDYVNSTFYDNTVFHRVICNFMIQGGGFKENLVRKETRAPIPYEGDNGLSNLRGTISYARTADPNSATSQFFINHRDNFGLDHGNTRDGYGYAVFGKVVRGMDVVDQIASVKTGTRPNGMQDVPIKPVKIYHIRLIDNK